MNDIERAKDILLDTDLYCVGYSTSELSKCMFSNIST